MHALDVKYRQMCIHVRTVFQYNYIDFRLDSLLHVQARFPYDILGLLKRALKCNIMYS